MATGSNASCCLAPAHVAMRARIRIMTLRCFSKTFPIAGRKLIALSRSLPTFSMRTRLSFTPCRIGQVRIGITLLHGSGCGRTEPDPCSGSGDADILWASEVQHTVQHVGGDRHLGRLSPVPLEAQPVTDDALPARDIRLHQGAPVIP